jgi:hypothetical protein
MVLELKPGKLEEDKLRDEKCRGIWALLRSMCVSDHNENVPKGVPAMTERKPKCRVNWNKPYRAGTICNYVDEVTNECGQTDRKRCPCGGIVRVPGFPKNEGAP